MSDPAAPSKLLVELKARLVRSSAVADLLRAGNAIKEEVQRLSVHEAEYLRDVYNTHLERLKVRRAREGGGRQSMKAQRRPTDADTHTHTHTHTHTRFKKKGEGENR